MEKQNECGIPSDRYTILPDKEHYRFLKTIEAADVWRATSPSRKALFHYLQAGIFPRLKFIRVPDDPYDANAVRIEQLSDHAGYEFGYVPRDDARELAPMIDAGRIFTGWIRSVDSSERRILIDIYERLAFPDTGISDIELHWDGLIRGTDVKISIPERKFFFHGSKIPFGSDLIHIELHFSERKWRNFVQPVLQKCNFAAWRNEYIDPYVRDGFQWCMKLRQESGEVRQIRGSNEIPEEWGTLENFIYVCRSLSEDPVEGISATVTLQEFSGQKRGETHRFSDRIRGFAHSLRRKLFNK